MTPKELFYFTGKCLTLDDYPENRSYIRSGFTGGEVQPEAFIWFCDKHLVLPAIYLKLKNHNLLDLFSPELKTHIAGIYLRNKRRNLEILQQAEEISRILDKEGIKPVYLKGTAHIMDKLYSDAGERLIGDIDLLVQNNDYLKAVQILKNHGCYTSSKVFYDVTKSTHYPPLIKKNTPVHLEIHRLPVNPPYDKWFNTPLNFQLKKIIPDLSNTYTQSTEYQVIHNFIHSRLNNLGHGFYVVSLRDIYDFYLLCKRVDETEVRSLSKEHNKLDCYYAITNRLFDSKFALLATKNKYSKHYIKRFDWFMEHPRAHRWHIFTVKLNELLFRRFFPSMGVMLTFRFWSRTFCNLTKADFYHMLAFRVRHFYEHYISQK